MVLIYRVDSRDKDASSISNTDFTVDTIPFHASDLRVKQIVFPNLFNNVRALPAGDNNSTFSYELATVPTTTLVADGFYSITQLIAALNTVLGANFVFSHDTITDLVSFQNVAGVDFELITTSSGNVMGDALGITVNQTVAAGNTVVLGNKPNLYNYSILYISSNKLSNSFNLISGQNRFPIIATIPFTVSYGELVVYEVNEQHTIKFQSSTNIENVDIKLINHNGEVVALPSNHHIQVLLEVDGDIY